MKVLFSVLLVAILAYAPFAQTQRDRVMPPEFISDNCSWFPDGNYADCCVEHDKAYYFGGSFKERGVADNQLYKCVKAKEGTRSKMIARMMWIGVRIGGVSFLPTPFRWGFGNKWPRKEPKK